MEQIGDRSHCYTYQGTESKGLGSGRSEAQYSPAAIYKLWNLSPTWLKYRLTRIQLNTCRLFHVGYSITDPSHESFRDDPNQERNTATAEATETPNLNQEPTVPVAAAVVATAAETVPLHPDGTNLQCLNSTPIQEESVDTVDEGATSNEAAPSEEAANSYDHLYGK